MSLRIAMVGACPYPVPQGSQVFLRDNAVALAARGHEVHLVVYGHGQGEDGSGLRLHRSIAFPRVSRTKSGPYALKPLLDLALVFTLRRVVRQERIEVVYAHNYEALLVALLAGKRPIIYHAHNAMSDELPYYFPMKNGPRQLGRWLDCTFPKRADHVCVPHRRLAGHLIVRGCVPAKVSIVPPPMDAQSFAPVKTGNTVPPVVYAGNLDPYQNLSLLFEAMKLVRRHIPEARLKIASAVPATFTEAEAIPTPDFEALRGVLAQDAVFAVPRVSWSGYPIKLLNAMAAGLGIVACESAAYPITGGVNGLVVPDNDAAAFAQAIERLLTDHRLRGQLGQQARLTLETEHRPERVAEQLEQIALKLLGRREPKEEGHAKA